VGPPEAGSGSRAARRASLAWCAAGSQAGGARREAEARGRAWPRAAGAAAARRTVVGRAPAEGNSELQKREVKARGIGDHVNQYCLVCGCPDGAANILLVESEACKPISGIPVQKAEVQTTYFPVCTVSV